jgi:nucleoside-diphosphate-sugar epimerase
VSGANGYIAAHVCDTLVKSGYRVRGTSRNIQRDAWLGEHFTKTYGEGGFELIQLEDMTLKNAFVEPLSGKLEQKFGEKSTSS